MSREEALDQAANSVALARTLADEVEFSPEDSTRTDPIFSARLSAWPSRPALTIINLPDTVGYAIPADYAAMFRMIRERVPGADKVILSAHTHDDLGLAVANTLAAIEAGARQVECTDQRHRRARRQCRPRRDRRSAARARATIIP